MDGDWANACRQRDALIFEEIDWPMLTVEKRSHVVDMCQCFPNQTARTNGRVHCVARAVNRVAFVEVSAGKVKQWVPKDCFGDMGMLDKRGAKVGNSLRVCATITANFCATHELTEVGDEINEGGGGVAPMCRMQLVPQIPGKDGAAFPQRSMVKA